jgi:hypothetical protein
MDKDKWSDIEGIEIINEYSDGSMLAKFELDDRQMFIEYDGTDLYFYGSNGLEYESKLYLEDHKCPILASKVFMDEHREDNAGFDEFSDAESESGSDMYPDILQQLALQGTKGRQLIIHTYGNKFKQYRNYKTECNFNALVIQSNTSGLNLKNGRGTDEDIQKAVASGRRFSEVMTRIVTVVETKDLHFIGIYCRAGHHRSVACGELLKKHIYPSAKIKHLTLNR